MNVYLMSAVKLSLVDVCRLTAMSYVRQVHCHTSFPRRLALLFPSSLSRQSKEDFRGSLLHCLLFFLFVPTFTFYLFLWGGLCPALTPSISCGPMRNQPQTARMP